MVSNIIERNDKLKWKEKSRKVNAVLKELCAAKNIYLIDHADSINSRHLNSSKLHLNRDGTRLLGNAFEKAISCVFP